MDVSNSSGIAIMADAPIHSFTQDFLENYSDGSLLGELRRVADLSPGMPLTKGSFAINGRVDCSTIVRRFGSWNAALRKACLEDRVFLSSHQKRRDDLTKSMVAELLRIAQSLRKVPSLSDFDAHAVEHASRALSRHFGSWSDALREAGLNPRRSRAYTKAYTKAELLENLNTIHAATGSVPTYESLSSPPSVFGPKPYARTWGSFSKALVEYTSSIDGQPLPARVRTLAMSDDELRQELRRLHQVAGLTHLIRCDSSQYL
jgi:hypothetical protein